MKSLLRNLCLGVSVLTMAFAASAANAQQSLSVSATMGTTTPDWTPADGMAQSQTPLNASINPSPIPPSGCTLRGPEWNWMIGPSSNPVQYSLDNSTWSEATSGYSARIVQPEPGLPAATLIVTYTVGGYWQFPCQIGAGQDDVPCGDTWLGSAIVTPKPKSVKLLSLTVTSGATQANVTGATNWAAVKLAGATVIAQATIQPNNQDAAAQIQWTGGNAVAGDLTQRSVDKGTSAMTAVTAQIGADKYTVNIWIIWATIVNQVTGTTPANAVQFGTRYDGTENLGVQTYDDGNWAVGKVVPIATVTPAGVNAVITGGFAFRRDKWRHDFEDGAMVANRYDNNWLDDTSDISFQAPQAADGTTLKLDANDKCYDRDAPNIGIFGQTYSYERYDNFREYLQWNGGMCSDYAGWYFMAVWLKNCTGENQVEGDATVVSQGALDLSQYTTAQYPPP